MHVPDSPHDLVRLGRLEQEPRSAGAEGTVDVLVEVEHRQHQDLGTSSAGHDATHTLDAVDARHLDVHQHDIGVEGLCGASRLCTVGGLTDDDEVVLRGEDRSQTGAQQRLVVGQHDADHEPTAGVIAWRAGRVVQRRKPEPVSRAVSSPCR